MKHSPMSLYLGPVVAIAFALILITAARLLS
jgi:hypothetical protein